MDETDVVIVVAFTSDGRRLLAVRHRDRGWELPGGRLHAGEDPVDGARREFREETGRTLENARLVHVRRRGTAKVYTFTGLVGDAVLNGGPPGEPVAETRLVRNLGQLTPLSFPDDPYGEIGRALGRRIL
jgi:8-oxo-dGTP diphosphatase